jgi:hypothetical protein
MNFDKLKDKYNFEMIIDYKNELDIVEQDIKYSRQFVNVFYLENYDSLITEVIEKIYLEVKDVDILIKWIENVDKSNNMLCPEDCNNHLMNFMLLFSFDNFQLLHNCLQSLYRYGVIDDENEKIINEYLNK